MTVWALFKLILPVFALIGVGTALRRFHWIEGVAESSMIRFVVYVCMPCLVFDTIVGNAALGNPGNLLIPPLAGFITTSAGIGVAYFIGRLLGLGVGTGLRTFALSAGVCNYSYLPLPIVGGIWGERTQGVVLIHNLGVDLSLWSVGMAVLMGASPRDGWKRLISPVLVAIILAVLVNTFGWVDYVPGFIRSMTHSLGVCAVPVGVVLTGVSIADYFDEPAKLVRPTVALGACAVRLLVLPILMLVFARLLPCPIELKRVLVVEAAMPAAVFPIIMARFYGGHPLTAVQIVLSTTALGLLTSPLWIRFGLSFVGVP